jgi:uncharacterized membrane protein YdjX (TVP38/TMEM64 family)
MTDSAQPVPQASPAPQLSTRAKFLGGPTAVLWGIAPGILGIYALARVDLITEHLRSLGPNGWLVFMAAFAVASGCGLLPTYAMSLIGGWVFGLRDGAIAAIGGFVGGALIGMAISLIVGGPAIGAWLERRPAVRVVRDALVGRGFWRTLGVVFLLRLPPNSPFAITNFAMTAARVHIVPYILGTALGLAPRTLIAVSIAAAAASAGEKNFQNLLANRPVETIIGVTITLAILIGLAQIGKAALRRAGIGTPTAR